DGTASPEAGSPAMRSARPLAAAGRAAPVPGLIRDDPKDPRAERTARPEARQRVVRPHEGLLCRVLRLGCAPRDQAGGAKRDLPIPLHQLLVGADVAASGPLDEFLV